MSAALTLAAPTVRETPVRRAWTRLKRRKGAMAALVVLCIIAALAIFAPLVAPHDPVKQGWATVRKAPSAIYWFGTDEVGRDLFSRIIYGARASLSAGVISVTIALLLGVPIGLLAGYRGGWLDSLISRFTDAMLACPFLILAIALAAFLGPSLTNAMIAIGVTAMPIFIRLTRGQVIGRQGRGLCRGRALCRRKRPVQIAFRHILPNIAPQLLVQATLTVATAIIAEAALSFLGLGQQPPQPSWGSMLNTAQRFLSSAPWMAIFPGPRDLRDGAVVQPARRRAQGRARSTDVGSLMSRLAAIKSLRHSPAHS